MFFVLGGVFHIGQSLWSLPVAACIGGVISTYLVFLLARSREDGRASIVMLLLTGTLGAVSTGSVEATVGAVTSAAPVVKPHVALAANALPARSLIPVVSVAV